MTETTDNYILDTESRPSSRTSQIGFKSDKKKKKSAPTNFNQEKFDEQRKARALQNVQNAVDLNGLTPEEVHEIRYAGIRYDMVVEIGDEGFETKMDARGKLAMKHYRTATEHAHKSLENYKIFMKPEIEDKLIKIAGRSLEDLGEEPFAILHSLQAFLGPRADHTPVEITVVRMRLGRGVEGNYHAFPSPLPIPFGKRAEFGDGEKEFHEISDVDFPFFDEDFVHILYSILITLEPSLLRKSMAKPKFPLVICKPHYVHATVMALDYLHQRALLAQEVKITTAAPAEFVVPAELNLSFCDLRTWDAAMRAVLKEMRLMTNPIPTIIDGSYLNHCHYHTSKSKLNCTTYGVCEMLEHCFIFAPFFGSTAPKRFVERFTVEKYIMEFSRDPTPEVQNRENLSDGTQSRWTTANSDIQTLTTKKSILSDCVSDEPKNLPLRIRQNADQMSQTLSSNPMTNSVTLSGSLIRTTTSSSESVHGVRNAGGSSSASSDLPKKERNAGIVNHRRRAYVVSSDPAVSPSFRSAIVESTPEEETTDSLGNPTPSPTFGISGELAVDKSSTPFLTASSGDYTDTSSLLTLAPLEKYGADFESTLPTLRKSMGRGVFPRK